jgi:hypothetical protein
MEPMKAYKYLGIEENHNIEQKWERKVEGVYKEPKIDSEHRAESKK